MTARSCAAQRSIDRAVDALHGGTPVLVLSGTDDRVVADVLIAAAHATPHWTAWLVRFTSGLVCAALPERRADELDLPTMARGGDSDDEAPMFAVAVDAAHGISTGISATDRARTARVLASKSSRPSDLVRPGHVLPVKTACCGVLTRQRSAEAAVDLCVIAGLPPVGLTAALLDEDGELPRESAIRAFAQRHNLPMVHIDSVVHHRLHHGDGRRKRVLLVQNRVDQSAGQPVRAVDFEDQLTGARHTVFIGGSTPGADPVVSVVVECVHHDPQLAAGCSCRLEFDRWREGLATDGGVVVYLRPPITSAPRLSVSESELIHGCVTAMLIELGFTAVTLAGAENVRLASTCGLTVSALPAVPEPRGLSAVAH
ncbi:3,4-dihydroxy-2-butanone-4-phosphate synthase [Mycolicibacterium wolinskyi]|uniref:3,4-dihydroxy-2-butanone-4-phosphate synthase n=1 Tax=Mycolicibacterium TaxID=1866885 RepID=UPI000A168EFC|nr:MULTISPECIES: 3,4-dihydroxy-2-butanone-4-phosphate synthase [Mycolicibacterium]MCV7287707.1 3,4-dihydroxy-2-butanone-4-phosphate synthase [Mycolicibacterium wolinskyi]MCV7294605.1 3,4-dihydroxy-2-butanone-4-phosphate synthase [Mycolicibacterium goodii]